MSHSTSVERYCGHLRDVRPGPTGIGRTSRPIHPVSPNLVGVRKGRDTLGEGSLGRTPNVVTNQRRMGRSRRTTTSITGEKRVDSVLGVGRVGSGDGI